MAEKEEMKVRTRAHVVVLPLPAKGHVNPMLRLAELVAASGHLVTFVNSEGNDRQVTPAARASLKERGIHLEALPDGLPGDMDRTVHIADVCESVMSTMPAPFEALLARLQPPPTCILADTLITFAISAAAKLSLPLANFWTQSAASFAANYLIANGMYEGPSQGEPLVPGAPFLREVDMNSFVRCWDPSQFMFRFVIGGLDCLSESRWIFINTFDDLEHDTLQALREQHHLHSLLSIGPLLPPSLTTPSHDSHHKVSNISTLWAEEQDCLSWLDKFEPKSVLFVSFGSLALMSSQQIEEIALGLKASGHPFLWVVRHGLIHGESHKFSEDYLEQVKNQAFFLSWAPQLEVLNHRSLGGFFTHGGWNSTLEAITARVPMLGWPYFADQAKNCTCIEKGWKIGSRLSDALMNEKFILRDVVKAKVKELMSSNKFKERANDLSILANKAIQEHGSSFKNIQTFLEDLQNTHNSNDGNNPISNGGNDPTLVEGKVT